MKGPAQLCLFFLEHYFIFLLISQLFLFLPRRSSFLPRMSSFLPRMSSFLPMMSSFLVLVLLTSLSFLILSADKFWIIFQPFLDLSSNDWKALISSLSRHPKRAALSFQWTLFILNLLSFTLPIMFSHLYGLRHLGSFSLTTVIRRDQDGTV